MDPMKSAIYDSLIFDPKNWTDYIGPKYHQPNDIKLDQILTPAQLGVITGIIIILFLNRQTEAKVSL